MTIRNIIKEQRQASKSSRAFNNAVVIVTGASSGIGAATAREFARHGAQVILAARRVEELAIQVQTIVSEGHRALAIPTDITDAAQITKLVEQTLEHFGHIDVLVNNAGIGRLRPFYKEPEEYINQVIDVNLRGAMLMTRAVLPGMLERHHGAIISMSRLILSIPAPSSACAAFPCHYTGNLRAAAYRSHWSRPATSIPT